jgi:hypothetical protein
LEADGECRIDHVYQTLVGYVAYHALGCQQAATINPACRSNREKYRPAIFGYGVANRLSVSDITAPYLRSIPQQPPSLVGIAGEDPDTPPGLQQLLSNQ